MEARKWILKESFFLVWVVLPFPCARIRDSFANCEPAEKLMKEAELIEMPVPHSKETQFQKQKLDLKNLLN